MNRTEGKPKQPRLNPFAFPSETSFQFALLIALVIGSSPIVIIGLQFALFGPELEAQIMICAEETIKPNVLLPTLFMEDPYLYLIQKIGKCVDPAIGFVAIGIVGSPIFVFGLGGVVYFLMPSWLIWRKQMRPLDRYTLPELTDFLDTLCVEVGLKRPPDFLWNPIDSVTCAMAFGCIGRYRVYLSGGLIVQFLQDRSTFKTILLHELAHIVNKDVNKTFYTIAIWRVYLLGALLPYLAWISWSHFDEMPSDIVGLLWRVLAMILMVYLAHNAVLRTREYYADIRASVWDQSIDRLEMTINNLSRLRKGNWRLVMGYHPVPMARVQALRDTSVLFYPSFWECVAVGVATTLVYSMIMLFFFLVLFSFQDLSISEIDQLRKDFEGLNISQRGLMLQAVLVGPTIIIIALMMGAAGLIIWKTLFSTLIFPENRRSTLWLGLGVGMGFIIGDIISFFPGLFYFDVGGSASIGDGLQKLLLLKFNLIWIILQLTAVMLLFQWVTASTSVWLEIAVRRQSFRWIIWVALGLAGFIFAFWYAPLVLQSLMQRSMILIFSALAEETAELIKSSPLPFASNISKFIEAEIVDRVSNLIAGQARSIIFFIMGYASNPVSLLTIIGIWAWPLAAWFWRNEKKSPLQEWPFLEQPMPPFTLSSQPVLTPHRALIIALVISLIYWLLLPLSYQAPADIVGFIFNDYHEGTAIYTGKLLLGMLFQGIAALAAAVCVRRLYIIHGLFAAFLTSVFCTLGLIFYYSKLIEIDYLFVSLTFATLTYPGFLIAIILGAIAAMIVSLVTNRHYRK